MRSRSGFSLDQLKRGYPLQRSRRGLQEEISDTVLVKRESGKEAHVADALMANLSGVILDWFNPCLPLPLLNVTISITPRGAGGGGLTFIVFHNEANFCCVPSAHDKNLKFGLVCQLCNV